MRMIDWRFAVLIGTLGYLTGCVPFITGMKTYQSGDTRIDFVSGVDFGFGMNAVDTVKNDRGIAPGAGYEGK